MQTEVCATGSVAPSETRGFRLPINILGERVAFQVSTNQAGAWFRLQKFIPSVRIDPWAPVRGVN